MCTMYIYAYYVQVVPRHKEKLLLIPRHVHMHGTVHEASHTCTYIPSSNHAEKSSYLNIFFNE